MDIKASACIFLFTFPILRSDVEKKCVKQDRLKPVSGNAQSSKVLSKIYKKWFQNLLKIRRIKGFKIKGQNNENFF